tara:strand:+ start:2330 stop:3355 length:1026 start_codon:yes stop_codon:yes gene_type:complete
MKKKILIFGGSGFIGSHFIDEIYKSDYDIINADKISYCSNLNYCKNFKNFFFYKTDLTNYKKTYDLIKYINPHYIINFAAESHVDRSIDNPNSFVKNNVIGTSNLLTAILSNIKNLNKNNKNFKLIHISTDEVYGSYKSGLANEKSNYLPNSPYAASKASSDLLCRSFFKTYNLPIVICNSSNNYGNRQYFEKFIPKSIISIRLGQDIEVYGDGKQFRQWIHVLDNVKAIKELISKGKMGETYNIGGNDIITNIKLIKIISKIIKDNFLNLVAAPPVIGFVSDRPGHDFRYAIDCKKIKSHTNWKPNISLEKGLYQTIDYYLNVKLDKKVTDSIKRRGKIG